MQASKEGESLREGMEGGPTDSILEPNYLQSLEKRVTLKKRRKSSVHREGGGRTRQKLDRKQSRTRRLRDENRLSKGGETHVLHKDSEPIARLRSFCSTEPSMP